MKALTVTVDETGRQRQFTAQEADQLAEVIREFVNDDLEDLGENYPGALALLEMIEAEDGDDE